jgi:hypothetical protein
LTGVAVNVTLVPVQMVLSASLETILTLAGKFGFSMVIIALLVAGLPVAQVAFEVMTTVTGCPDTRVVVVYVALFDPTGVTPEYH